MLKIPLPLIHQKSNSFFQLILSYIKYTFKIELVLIMDFILIAN